MIHLAVAVLLLTVWVVLLWRADALSFLVAICAGYALGNWALARKRRQGRP